MNVAFRRLPLAAYLVGTAVWAFTGTANVATTLNALALVGGAAVCGWLAHR